MGLWDAISGKDIQFNQVQREANSHVCKVLQSFVTSRLERYPKKERMFLDARNELYAFFMSSSACIAQGLEHDLAGYKDAIVPLDKPRYLWLVSFLHTAFIVHDYLSAPEEPGARSWFNLVSEGVCDIYGLPDSYMADWAETVSLCATGELAQSGLTYSACDDFFAVLGVKHYALDALTFSRLLRLAASGANSHVEDPSWEKTVDREIAAH